MLKWLILRILRQHINKKYKSCEKEIRVFNRLMIEAKECENERYQQELQLGINYQEKLKQRCDLFLSIID